MIELKLLDPKVSNPTYGTEYSAGLDLSAHLESSVEIPPLRTCMVGTGIALNMMTMPQNMMAIIVPRSGKGAKEGKVLGNTLGIIDKDYTGELKLSVYNRNPDKYVTIEPGERIAQLIFVPILHPDFNIVEEFSSITARGEGGFGSTGS